jgi:tetratricopeptide (TPR) repeat protein
MAAPTICLSMIVKNEAHVIERCLRSMLPLIDHWVISDTGSTDGTQAIIRSVMAHKPGTLVEKPWVNFAHNRNEVLQLAQRQGDYVIFIDADETASLLQEFDRSSLVADAYSLTCHYGDTRYGRVALIRANLPWRWSGVLHEFLECDTPFHTENLVNPIIVIAHEGARSRDPNTYKKDAVVLETALQGDLSDFLRTRYTFYLAQTYRDAGMPEQALRTYLQRADMAGWVEERYISLYNAAQLQTALQHPVDTVLATYDRAIALVPNRAEARHDAARACRLVNRWDDGCAYAQAGLELKPSPDMLFVDQGIYDYRLRDEFAVCTYWAGRYQDSLDACLAVLAQPATPQDQHPRILSNARFASDQLKKQRHLGVNAEKRFAELHSEKSQRPLAPLKEPAPRVLVAILAKQKESFLPLYLQGIENLDYPKSSIVLYVRTNNNTDNTEHILKDWLDRVGHLYAAVEFRNEDTATQVEAYAAHEWNAPRFAVLGEIRQISLEKTHQHQCDYYFTSDVDNFVRPNTLAELVALDLPFIAPFLRHVDCAHPYSNYHAAIDQNGYMQETDQYWQILHQKVRGIIEMPVVHATYLLRADVAAVLRYQDGSERHEYVIVCDSARTQGIRQYLDNREVYGYITFSSPDEAEEHRNVAAVKKLFAL